MRHFINTSIICQCQHYFCCLSCDHCSTRSNDDLLINVTVMVKTEKNDVISNIFICFQYLKLIMKQFNLRDILIFIRGKLRFTLWKVKWHRFCGILAMYLDINHFFVRFNMIELYLHIDREKYHVLIYQSKWFTCLPPKYGILQ